MVINDYFVVIINDNFTIFVRIKNYNMKKILLFIATIILILVAIRIITNGIQNEILTKDEYFDIMMSIEQKKLELPIKTGEGMILNDIQLSGKKIKYFYKADNEISNMTNNDIENYKKRWRQNIIQISKNNPNNKSLVHENISLHYFLVDKDNKPILNFEISPNEYK